MSAPDVESGDRLTYCVAHRPTPWVWSPWQYSRNGYFHGRWDDPNGVYRVLYTGATKYACLLEVLAQFRVSLADLSLYDEIEGNDMDHAFGDPTPGRVPLAWLSLMCWGRATLSGDYIDIGSAGTLAWLRPLIAPLAVRAGKDDVDGGIIRSSDSSFTRAVGAFIHDWNEDGQMLFDGIRYESRHGNDLVLYATFERQASEMTQRIANETHYNFDPDDSDLMAAMANHGLVLEARNRPIQDVPD